MAFFTHIKTDNLFKCIFPQRNVVTNEIFLIAFPTQKFLKGNFLFNLCAIL